jgi:hypothetical protein
MSNKTQMGVLRSFWFQFSEKLNILEEGAIQIVLLYLLV